MKERKRKAGDTGIITSSVRAREVKRKIKEEESIEDEEMRKRKKWKTG